MIARRSGLDPPRTREVRAKRAADGATAGRCAEHRAVIDRLERKLLIVFGEQLLDLSDRRAGFGREDQLLTFIERHARENRQIKTQVPLRGAANPALQAVADDLERLALGER